MPACCPTPRCRRRWPCSRFPGSTRYGCLRRRKRRSPGSPCRPIGRWPAVGGLDFAAFVDALTPWVELALEKGTVQLSPQDAEMARKHAKTALEVLKVYRGSVSETYVEGKITVTHSRTRISRHRRVEVIGRVHASSGTIQPYTLGE